MQEISSQLQQTRKDMKPPEEYPKKSQLADLKVAGELEFKSVITDFDVGSSVLACCGVDKKVRLHSGTKILAESQLDFDPSIIRIVPELGQNDEIRAIIGSRYGEAYSYNLTKGKMDYQINTRGVISDMSFPPLEKHFAFCSGQKHWNFFDLDQGKNICTIPSDLEVNCIQFHPDGLLLASGHPQGSLSIWDIRTQTVFTTLNNEDMKGNALKQIAFSNKGY